MQRLKGKAYRRLMPLYFFRLASPGGFHDAAYQGLRRDGDTDVRAVFLSDSLERFVYVLCLPEKDQNRADYILSFTRATPTSGPSAR